MACWTNHEISRLVDMHRERVPTVKELLAAFPRHTLGSIRFTCFERHIGRHDRIKWLKIAHLHFSQRKA
jgi:hypothetical protein